MRKRDFGQRLILWSTCFLTGCCVSLSKSRQTENLLPRPSLEESRENSLNTPFFARGEWPSETWWEMFDTPQLNALIEMALDLNPTIQSVKTQIAFTKERAIIARSRLFPLIFFDATDSWQYLSEHGLYRAFNPTLPLSASLIDLTFSFSYEFDFWGKNTHLFYAAIGEEKAAIAETAAAQLIITTGLAQAYFALKANLHRKRLYEQLVDVQNKTYVLEKHLLKNSLFSNLPPLQSEEQVFEAKKLLEEVEAEIAADRHLISILIGIGPDSPLAIDDTFCSLTAKILLPDTLSIDLLARRPDLMAQIWRVEALGHVVGAAIADFYPRINLTGFAGLESVLYSVLFTPGSLTCNLEPALSLPIFTAGAIRANVGAKKAEFDAAVFDYNTLLLKSAQEVADFLAFAQSIFQQKKEQESIVQKARARYELTYLRKQNGLDSLFDVYAIEIELIQKELENVTLLYSQYLAAIKLIKALGGGYYSECIPLHA